MYKKNRGGGDNEDYEVGDYKDQFQMIGALL